MLIRSGLQIRLERLPPRQNLRFYKEVIEMSYIVSIILKVLLLSYIVYFDIRFTKEIVAGIKKSINDFKNRHN